MVGCVGLSSCKFKYKLAIKQAFQEYERMHTNEINEHFLNKNILDFWKVWNKKFKRSVYSDVEINGLDDDWCIAEIFASHFANVYDLA